MRQRVGGLGGAIPPMPSLVPAEFAIWMDERQSESQEARDAGDNIRVLALTAKLSEGAKRMCEMTSTAS